MNIDNIVIEGALFSNIKKRNITAEYMLALVRDQEQTGLFGCPGIPYLLRADFFAGNGKIQELVKDMKGQEIEELSNVLYISSPAFPKNDQFKMSLDYLFQVKRDSN